MTDRNLLVLMLAFPALMYFGLMIFNWPKGATIASLVGGLVPNYIFFALPHYLSLIILAWIKTSLHLRIGVLGALNGIIVIMALSFALSSGSKDGLVWLSYYPVAFVTILGACLGSQFSENQMASGVVGGIVLGGTFFFLRS
jgi:hypothetical protein